MDRLREHRFEWGLLLAYSTLVFAMIPLHEPWRDEAQAWLIARDLDLIGILKQSAAEGSPGLWQLILAPWAKLGFPYASERFIHSILACAAVAVVAISSPFARWQKVAFAASYLMAFEYSVIARSYVISVLLLVSLAAFDHRRHERPVVYGLLVLLLANTNLHSLTIAAVLGASFVFELARQPQSRLRWIVPCVMAVGGLLAVWQLGERSWTAFAVVETDPVGIFGSIRKAFHPVRPATAPYLIAALVAFASVLWSLRRQTRALIILCTPLLGWAFTPMSEVTHAPRHAGFIMMLVIFTLWTTWDSVGAATEETASQSPRLGRLATSGGVAGLLVFASLAVSSIDGATALWSDARGRFSSAKAMASYLERDSITEPIAAFRSPTASSLLPYLPERRFWYVDGTRWGTFVHWNREITLARELSNAEVVARVREEFGADLPLLLMSREIDEPEQYGYRLRHAETELAEVARGNERYFLYEPFSGGT